MNIKPGKRRILADDVTEFGVVEKLSIQGDFLYAIVRKEGVFYKNDGNEVVNSKTELFGANGTPEQHLVLAEILIPTDILPGMVTIDYKFFIGKKVEVVSNKGIPRIALLSRVASFSSARGIAPEDMAITRGASSSREITSGGRAILQGKGYENDRVGTALKEKYIDISTGPDILSYGVEQSWDIDIQKDPKNKERKDMSKISSFQHVSGLTGKPQKEKSCYLPILSIGGKV